LGEGVTDGRGGSDGNAIGLEYWISNARGAHPSSGLPPGLLRPGYHARLSTENWFVCYNMRTASSGRLTQR
jgi:hypothetical protein